MDFKDTQVVNKSFDFVSQRPFPQEVLTSEQEAKKAQLVELTNEVGAVSFDAEVDALIAAMTEIRDR